MPRIRWALRIWLDADADAITHLRADREARAAEKEPTVVADGAIAGGALQLVVRLEQSVIAKLGVAVDGRAVILGPLVAVES